MCKKLIFLTPFVLLFGLAANVNAQVGKGNILFEYYYHNDSSNGWDLNVLLNYAAYPDSPSASEWRTSFEGQTDWRDGYGTRVRGYLYPPQTGDYTFWIASDDQSQLWLSTDDTPANAVQIASVPGWTPSRDFDNTGGGTGGPSQKSNPIRLEAGKTYYIWAITSDGGGGDNLAVAWQGPGVPTRTVIAGSYLSPVIRPIDLIAVNPNPADGAVGVPMPLLQWEAGKTAKWHDLYFGTNPTPGPAEYIGRQPFTVYWHAPGLAIGTKYYWRVDEVEADGVTVHIGDIWSFTSAPSTAYNPVPADGAKFLGTDADISWTAGVGALTHDVYFGTSQADVAAGTGGTFKGNQPLTKYDPGTLARGATYYWRIDEVDASGSKHTGEVWRFRTRPEMISPDPDLKGWWKLDDEGTGTAIDYSGNDRDGTFVGDPEWVAGYDGDAMYFDGDDHVDTGYTENLARWTITCWVTSPTAPSGRTQTGPVHREQNYQFNWDHGDTNYRGAAALNVGGTWYPASYMPLEANTWYHLAATYDGSALKAYRNGMLITTNTAPEGNPSSEGNTLKLARHAAAAQFFIGTVDDARVYSRALTQEEIQQVMQGDPTLARNPKPANKSTTDVEKAVPLTWTPGNKAAKHDVYLGTDALAVEAADTSDTTGVYRGRQDPNSFSPPEGIQFGKTYYWRIDEFNTDGTISTGRIWSFSVADYLIVDNFEDYDDVVNRIFDVWADYFVNNTGATVGYFDPPFTEHTIVHSGSQSMPYRYDNDGTVNEGTQYEKTGTKFYSEVEREWAAPQDWTRKGVASLRLYFQGAAMRFADTAGTITMSAAGADIWGTADQFRYAYKQLNGDGQIVAKVVSIGGPGTNEWRKAGVMIREGLDAGSRHAFMAITPAVAHGIAFQNRPVMSGDSVSAHYDVGLTAPLWVKLVRQGNQFTGYYSTNGVNWIQVPSRTASDGSPNPQTINMSPNAYIGLALTSHQSGVSCVAQFSDVTITGTTGAWTIADIGVAQPGNDPAPMYVVLQDSANKTAVVTHSDAAATLLATWTEWNIDLAGFTGVNLRAIKKIYIGVGDRLNPQRGGAGRLYVDDIGLYRPAPPQ